MILGEKKKKKFGCWVKKNLYITLHQLKTLKSVNKLNYECLC